ncbi:MAG: sulfite exporter TauE/SafE family protein [Thermoplasmataceae archaeon]
MLDILILIIVGVAVGALTGMTGSSGVLVVVPALGLMGFTFQRSVGASLLVDVITTSIVIYVYLRKHSIYVRSGITMGLGAIIGAQIGSRVAVSVSQLPLEIGFVALTAILSFQMYRRAFGKPDERKGVHVSMPEIRALMLAFGLSIPVGFLTGTIGTSGGIMFIGITMLLFTIPAQKMVGTATLAMLLSALSGTVGYASLGLIDFTAAAVIGVASLASGSGFSYLAHRTSEKGIYAAIGTVFLVVIFVELFKIIL